MSAGDSIPGLLLTNWYSHTQLMDLYPLCALKNGRFCSGPERATRDKRAARGNLIKLADTTYTHVGCDKRGTRLS